MKLKAQSAAINSKLSSIVLINSWLSSALLFLRKRLTNIWWLFQACSSSVLRNCVISSVFIVILFVVRRKFPLLLLASNNLGKNPFKYLKASKFWSRAFINCLIRPNFICKVGINIFLCSTTGSHLTLCFPIWNSTRSGYIRCWLYTIS